ncbi:hypothetical protein VTN96DRAFT_6597 [Rasamsonia emersonii]
MRGSAPHPGVPAAGKAPTGFPVAPLASTGGGRGRCASKWPFLAWVGVVLVLGWSGRAARSRISPSPRGATKRVQFVGPLCMGKWPTPGQPHTNLFPPNSFRAPEPLRAIFQPKDPRRTYVRATGTCCSPVGDLVPGGLPAPAPPCTPLPCQTGGLSWLMATRYQE